MGLRGPTPSASAAIALTIALREASLTVFTREVLPREWAREQGNLASAYAQRIRGERADNLEMATAAYEAALTVITRDALPRDHLRVSKALGWVQLEAKNWQKAREVLTSARAAFLVLFGQGLDEAEGGDLVSQAQGLFAEAAFAAAQQGDLESALNLLMEGRGRLMAVSLKSLELPSDQRSRLEMLRVESEP